MSNKKEKVPETKVKEPTFIRFSEIQCGYLNEMRGRQLNELNQAIEKVYKALGILEKIREAPVGKYRLRMQDFSGVDVLPVKPEPEKKEMAEKETVPKEEPPPETNPEEKNNKDH